ncbi:hypothetical protein VOLCADRAFT_106562 [Volvox carteri f. nagariensis]|uniref:VTT domain-containing protein n=1 Tax=Volvox carteri f. nagariensis TaxID=3068 RepID=D8U874_VOLCA|nr:uncharacterized protein VOLCADRAFT_106562 [Volvox carteri f. nagariensis]EFJ44040.1 hypothetical protein VOLCADRAFT_106562 [Volvox carteri f. nagariensis]|eukprot:XP_002954841.1 hypothetical protein VOLCADRAFT_106562 [Volvox carteri f. nagariensis]
MNGVLARAHRVALPQRRGHVVDPCSYCLVHQRNVANLRKPFFSTSLSKSALVSFLTNAAPDGNGQLDHHQNDAASGCNNTSIANSSARIVAAARVAAAMRALSCIACTVAATALLTAALPGAAFAGEVAAGAAGGNPVAGLLSFILHLDKHLAALIAQYGAKSVYGLLFAIVFAETGLVLTPFLPGDSLLFAAGAFAGMGQLDVGVLCGVFIVAAIIGDAVNYAVGARIGQAAVSRGVVSREHIAKTEKFYEKYGGKTVVLARFVPIVRTFAPFVAGIGSMPYGKFAWYNVAGALLWTFLFVGAGFFFGNLPFVRKNFTLVVLGIVAVSVMPVIYELWAARQEAGEAAASSGRDGGGGGGGEGGGGRGADGGGPGSKPNFA